jgi:hypothetical protein
VSFGSFRALARLELYNNHITELTGLPEGALALRGPLHWACCCLSLACTTLQCLKQCCHKSIAVLGMCPRGMPVYSIAWQHALSLCTVCLHWLSRARVLVPTCSAGSAGHARSYANPAAVACIGGMPFPEPPRAVGLHWTPANS